MKKTILLQQISAPTVPSNMSVDIFVGSLISERLLGKLDHVHFFVNKNSKQKADFTSSV